MTRHEIATLACKILALWLCVQVAIEASYIPVMIIGIIAEPQMQTSLSRWAYLLMYGSMGVRVISSVVVAIILWMKAPAIARHMVCDDPTPVTSSGINEQSVLTIACTGLGIYLFIDVLRELIRMFVEIAGGPYVFSHYWHDNHWNATWWSAVVGLGFSLWLIFGSRGIVRLLWLLRYSNVSQPSPDAPRSPNPPENS